MPLLAVLDEGAHGALDESLKTLYVQNTDTKEFHLDLGPDEAAKLAHNLRTQFDNKKTELTNKHRELNELKAKITGYEAIGKTAEEIKAALESNRPEEVTKLVTDHQTEIATLKSSYEEPIKKATEKAERLERQIQQSLQTAAIQKLRNEHDLNETADFVLRDFIRVVPQEEGSDEYTVKVFENGQPALVAGQEMKPEQLISQWREQKKFPAMFNAGDGGGTGGTNRQTGNGSKQYEGLMPVERLNLAREQGVKTP